MLQVTWLRATWYLNWHQGSTCNRVNKTNDVFPVQAREKKQWSGAKTRTSPQPSNDEINKEAKESGQTKEQDTIGSLRNCAWKYAPRSAYLSENDTCWYCPLQIWLSMWEEEEPYPRCLSFSILIKLTQYQMQALSRPNKASGSWRHRRRTCGEQRRARWQELGFHLISPWKTT